MLRRKRWELKNPKTQKDRQLFMMRPKKRKKVRKHKILREKMQRQSSSHKWKSKSMKESKLKTKKRIMLSYHQLKER